MRKYHKLIFILFLALATAATVLYSENRKLFPHSTHKENDVKCIVCHPGAKTSKKAGDRLFPDRSVCSKECHEKDILKKVDFVKSQPRWGLKFNHEIHVEQDVKCITCHDGINNKDFQKGSAFPPMKVCFKCHNGDDAPKTCTFCHEERVPFPHKLHIVNNELGCEECHKGIKSSITTRGGKDIPGKGVCNNCHEAKLKFSDVADFPYRQTYEFNHKLHTVGQELGCKECHKALYEKEHPKQKELVPKMEYCFECHDNNTATQYCMLCHLNPTKPKNHYYDWDNFHRKTANRDMQNCISCHKSKQFCISCHKGIKKPEKTHNSNFEVTHRFEARTSLKNCYSCHSRRQCISCHVSYGVSYKSETRIKNVHGSLSTWISSRHKRAGRLRLTTCTACHVKADCYGCHNPTNVGPRKR